jgi:hypothetical protein
MQAWEDTANAADLLVCVDDDDPTLKEYSALGCPLYVGPRLRLGGTLNQVARANCFMYDNLGFMGDDHLPRTESWDDAMEEALEVSMIAYGNDLLQGVNLPTAVFMQSVIVQRIGYMVPPGIVHLYLDNFWRALGERLESLQYLPGVIIEHLHPSCGKADNDAQYEEVNAPSLYSHDGRLYQEYLQGQLALDVAKIRANTSS